MTPAAPLIPDAEEARRWVESELADPVYQRSEPTWFDRTAQSVRDWLFGLFTPDVSADWASVLAIALGVAAIVGVIIVLLVWAVPRRGRRHSPENDELFGERDPRSARALRRAADTAASREHWPAAIVLRFRATARSATERGLTELRPGTTAQQFARTLSPRLSSSGAVPTASVLIDAAAIFDGVRYADRAGSASEYAQVAAADDALSLLPAPPEISQ